MPWCTNFIVRKNYIFFTKKDLGCGNSWGRKKRGRGGAKKGDSVSPVCWIFMKLFKLLTFTLLKGKADWMLKWRIIALLTNFTWLKGRLVTKLTKVIIMRNEKTYFCWHSTYNLDVLCANINLHLDMLCTLSKGQHIALICWSYWHTVHLGKKKLKNSNQYWMHILKKYSIIYRLKSFVCHSNQTC